jgi:hypothetical protein
MSATLAAMIGADTGIPPPERHFPVLSADLGEERPTAEVAR